MFTFRSFIKSSLVAAALLVAGSALAADTNPRLDLASASPTPAASAGAPDEKAPCACRHMASEKPVEERGWDWTGYRNG